MSRVLKSQGSRQTLPPSTKSTALKLPTIGTRASVEKFRKVWPPIGKPEALNGDTSNRPHPRNEVAPPRKYRLKNGTGSSTAGSPLGPSISVLVESIDPARARTATTALLPID